VFVNRFGEPINKYLVNILVRTYAQKAGITKKVTPHIFRHTFATSLINNNADIRYVQEMLGHADIRTTQEYLRVVKGDLKRVHQKTHPREKQAMELQSYIPQIERFNHE
jgi:integrase/recombinase XerD